MELGSPATRASQARRTCKTGDGARWQAGTRARGALRRGRRCDAGERRRMRFGRPYWTGAATIGGEGGGEVARLETARGSESRCNAGHEVVN